MATYSEKVQGLMNEFYTEWQKEENRGKDKWETLGTFSQAHQIAVVFGNFNYQVENGGLSQWVYNGYFHDDAEKLAELLEADAGSDERFQAILDIINALDRRAQETDCDRDGYYRDPDAEDGTSFIGDSIDCGEFDTWYYEHCGKEDWWATVSAIMDKVAARDLPPVQHGAPAPEKTAASPAEANTPIISVTIENARKPEIGGFTIPLPYPREALTQWMVAIEADASAPDSIKIVETRGSIQELHSALWQSGASLNELAYLAAKVDGFSAVYTDIFCAALASGKFDGDITAILNLTENLTKYELQPAFDTEQYGEFLLQDAQEMSTQVFERLEQSEEIEERQLAEHITRMEKLVDPAAYAKSVIQEEKGVFTEYGYLTLHGELEEKYHGAMDIPVECWLLGEEKPLAPEALRSPPEKESVIAKIRAAKAAAKKEPPAERKPITHDKSSGPEL